MSQARDILDAKLALEHEIGTAIVRAGLVYIWAWVATDGRMSVWQRQGHQDQIERVLIRHYSRVVYVMRGITPPKDAELRGAVLTLRHMEALRGRAHQSAMMILAGIDRDLSAALASRKSDDDDDIETKAPRQKKPIGMSVIAEGTFGQAGQAAANKLKKRRKAVGNIETQEPVEGARFELVPQAEANGRVKKVWNSLLDGRERPAHHEAHGQEQFVDVPFDVGGEKLRFPGDRSLGASLGNVINCFPGETRVSGSVVAATRHLYDGDMVKITTRRGHQLSGTPNHPVLTPEGWVALGSLNEGSHIICRRVGVRDEPTTIPANNCSDVDHVEPVIEQVFGALAQSGRLVSEDRLAVDFHGDRPTVEVDIVGSDRVLQVGRNAALDEQRGKISLAAPHLSQRSGPPLSLAAHLNVAGAGPTAGGVGGHGDLPPVFVGGAREPQQVGVAAISDRDAGRDEALSDGATAQADGFGQSEFRLPGDVAPDDVVRVEIRAFRGHVYNLQTVHGLYHANGIVVHNCRCFTTLAFVSNDGTRVPVDLGTPSLPARRTWHEGDEVGFETPVSPTVLVTLNGRTRGRIVLADETFATLRQERPDTVVIRQHGRDIARATFDGSGAVTSIAVDPEYTNYGLDTLLRESIRHSTGQRWPTAPLSGPPPKP